MKSFIPLLLVLLLASDAVCEPAELRELFGVPSEAKRTELYQRKEAPHDTFPFYVSLRRIDDGQHFCAGTLISPSYVLTSASCVDHGKGESSAEGIAADVGTHSRDRPENAKRSRTVARKNGHVPEYDMEVEEVIVHEKYSNGTEGRPPYDVRYDVAILKLKERGEDLLNVGLGRFESEEGDYAESLEMAVFPHMPHKKCRSYFKKRPQNEFFGRGKEGNLTESASLCASGAGEYCQLDKGSSLVRYRPLEGGFVVVGFANDATRECSHGAPYVFSSISFHIKWIIRLEGVLKDIASHAMIGRGFGRIDARVASVVDAPCGRFPYAASIRSTRFPHKHRCAGVLISPKHVLATASCVPNEGHSVPSEIIVYIGGTHAIPVLDADGELIRATRIITHPKRRAKRNTVDLALVVLEKKSKKTPVRLPVNSRGCCESGTPMRVFGWRSQSMGSKLSGYLQTGETDYISRKQCISDHGVQNLNRKAICAGHRFSGIIFCRGDYGTPLLLTGGAEDVLIGIGFTDVTNGCGDEPSEFLRIAFFMRWIKQYVSNF